jgi:hypothetical protein
VMGECSRERNGRDSGLSLGVIEPVNHVHE